MPKNALLNGSIDQIDLDFVEREATPELLMKLGIQLHLARLSLSNTVSILEVFGVERARSTVHNWVHKADLQPANGQSQDHVAVDETVIQLNGQQYWLYAAVDPEPNELLHTQLEPTTTTVLAQSFLATLQEKHDVDDAVFLVDYAQHLTSALRRAGLQFQTVRHGNRNAVERIFRAVKRHTSSFCNIFFHVQPTTAETWLQAFAVWWNSLN